MLMLDSTNPHDPAQILENIYLDIRINSYHCRGLCRSFKLYRLREVKLEKMHGMLANRFLDAVLRLGGNNAKPAGVY